MWKRASKWGMAVHVLTHPVVSILLVVPYLTMTWVKTPWFSLSGWICVLLVAFFHWLQDEWRVWSIQRAGAPDNTAFFLWDQTVHIAGILAFTPTFPDVKPELWVFL